MGNTALLRQLGIFVVDRFLDSETCSRLSQQAREASSTDASVQPHPGQFEVDLDSRRARLAGVSTEPLEFLRGQFNAVRPQLEQYFKTTLQECEDPETVVYGVGDFYAAHIDGDDELPRKVSLVLYLNGQTEFEGGDLVFYGLMGSAAKKTGIPLQPSEGLLVAFDSRILHEVRPVTRGVRVAAITFYS